MGIKSTMDLSRIEALHIIAQKLDVVLEDDVNRQIERILEHVTDYNNIDSEYYYNNFMVSEKKSPSEK